MTYEFRSAFRSRLKNARLLGILRDAPAASLRDLARCLVEAGIEFIEVTMNTPDALAQIACLRKELDGKAEVGAGTVLTGTQAQDALSAGATFLVSPCFSRPVQEVADARSIPTLPGAFTPQEIWEADRDGAAMVKLFPAKSAGGPGYVKELRGPFRDIPLLVCGGVSPQTAGEYLGAGADALAFGGSIFSQARLAAGDFDAILSDLKALRHASIHPDRHP
ncbi:MAG: 2-deydro-3-deoxyphosphogluconate aldolase/4-hydroxy-2-oxoglutarate aldolase [Fibrobacterota bacterium]|jgi:2-dehydro-3-deoxyphosphogluconate aldolase/(4S)-4-hydroxy-2-oxoglutarate aldolase